MSNDLILTRAGVRWQWLVVFAVVVAAAVWGDPLSTSAAPSHHPRNQTVPPISSLLSDDFNSCTLDETRWRFINPRGDATMRLANRQQLAITVPGGVSHDIWNEGNFAPRVMQTIDDTDFAVETKFDSALRGWIKMQGLLAEEDADDLVRVNFQSDGRAIKLMAVTLDHGAATIIHSAPISETEAARLRLTRINDDWTVQHSADGIAWTTGVTFTHPLTVTGVGVFAGNASNTPPTHTALIDYVFNPVSPISPEDSTQNTLSTAVVGQGKIKLSPLKEFYDCGEVVTATAQPVPGWAFKAWSGDMTGNVTPATIAVNRAQNITATFTEERYTVDLTIEGQGNVEVDPLRADYLYGDAITLTVQPAPGWSFLSWSGDLSGDKPRKRVTIKGDQSISATFIDDTAVVYSLETRTVGNGTVAVTPAQQRYLPETEVILSAQPDAEWRFTGWSGALNSSAPTATLSIQANTIITATFMPQDQFTLTVHPDGNGRVTLSKVGPYHEGETVTLTATPDDGWSFTGWTRDVALRQGGKVFEMQPSLTVQMTADVVYIANFKEGTDGPTLPVDAVYLPLIQA